MNHFNTLKGILIGASIASAIIFAPAALAGKDPDTPNHRYNPQPNHDNGCARYRLSASGGDAGFRLMNNTRDFRKTSNGSVIGQICTSGRVTVELSKRHPNTHVSLEVNGREYVFAQGDRGDKHANSWFRRYVHIDLRGHSSYGGNQNSNNNRYGHNDKPRPGKSHGQSYNDSHHNNNNFNNNHYPDYDNNGYGHSYSGAFRHNGKKSYHSGNRGHQSHKHFDAHSKRHQKAHRRGIPHEHHGQYFAYQ